MPDAPAVNPLTRYLLENPIPLAGVLLIAAACLLWSGLRQGLVRRQGAALIVALAAVAVYAVASLVTTSGERARTATVDFVTAVKTSDLVGAMALVADDAGLSIGSPNNPGVDRDAIRSTLSWFDQRYTIASNHITNLDYFSMQDDEGLVHMTCFTEVEGGYGPTVTSWVIKVRRQDDGTWKIHRMTWISVNGRPADGDLISR